MRKVLLGAALSAAVFVSGASASAPPRVRLALVPLRKSSLGAAAHGFALAHDSGRVSNAEAALHSQDGTKATLEKLGRLDGYALDYGNAFSGAPGLAGVRTGVERYKTAADARRGLAFWRKEDSKLGRLNQPGFTVTNVPVTLPAVGKGHFACLTSYSASNIAPVSGLDEQVAEGRYVLDVIVTAGSASTAEDLAPKLARKLDARLRLALGGRLHAKPVKVPKPGAGPPPGGPDLRKLALRASDLAGKATPYKQYVVDPAAVSDYSVVMLPAGPFHDLDQEIEWYPSANEASFYADFHHAAADSSAGATSLDLAGLGDGAQATIVHGSPISGAVVVFASGRLAEYVFAESKRAIVPSDVIGLAHAAAARIDAAGLGS